MSVGSDLLERLRALVHRGREDRELADELAFHLEMEARRQEAAGTSPGEAQRRARLALGGTDQTMEAVRDARGTRLLESLAQDLRYGARALRKRPGFTAVAVLTLALGVGATASVFSAVEGVLLRPLPYAAAERIVHIGERRESSTGAGGTTSYDNFADWQRLAHSFSAMGLAAGWAPTLTGRGEPTRVSVARVTSGIFDVFHVQPYLGRAITPSDAAPGAPTVLVLSYDFWRSRFGGDAGVLGRTVLLNLAPARIVGVLPPGFQGADRLARPVWSNFVNDTADGRTGRSKDAFALLRPGVGLHAAQAEMTRLSRTLQLTYPQANKGEFAVVDPLLDRVVGNARPALLLLLGASLLVLLIACANLSNLLLVRGLARRHELAVRAAVGAGRGRLVRQLLTEGALLAALGALAGLLLAILTRRLLLELGPRIFATRPPALDARALLIALTAAVGTTLIFALLPAWRVAPVDPQSALRETGARLAGGAGGTRRGLAIAQLALAVLLLSGAMLVLKSFARVLAVDAGIRPDHLLTLQITLPGARYDSTRSTLFYSRLAARVQALPGVRGVAVTSIVPLSGDFDRVSVEQVEGEGPRAGADAPQADRYIVSPSYLATMGIRLVRGRGLTDEDRYDAPLACLLDTVFARRLFRGQDPIGRRMRLPQRDGWVQVVGLVGHVKTYGLDVASQGQIYLSNVQFPWRWSALVVRTSGDPLALAPAITRAVHELDPDQPVDQVAAMDQLLADGLRARRFTLDVLGAFALVALALATVGVYGVVAYGVAQRRREFGVRLTLGAGRSQIVRLVLGEAGRIAVVGAAIGAAGVLAATRLLASLLFAVSARDPGVLSGVVAGLVLLALAAALLPAIRATRVDATEVLRGE